MRDCTVPIQPISISRTKVETQWLLIVKVSINSHPLRNIDQTMVRIQIHIDRKCVQWKDVFGTACEPLLATARAGRSLLDDIQLERLFVAITGRYNFGTDHYRLFSNRILQLVQDESDFHCLVFADVPDFFTSRVHANRVFVVGLIFQNRKSESDIPSRVAPSIIPISHLHC